MGVQTCDFDSRILDLGGIFSLLGWVCCTWVSVGDVVHRMFGYFELFFVWCLLTRFVFVVMV